MRRAYSIIFTRLRRSIFTFSKERRSPSRRAILAWVECHLSDSAVFGDIHASQPALFPIRFVLVRSGAIRSGESGGRRQGRGPADSSPAQVAAVGVLRVAAVDQAGPVDLVVAAVVGDAVT